MGRRGSTPTWPPRGWHVSRKTVAKAMRIAGIQGISPRKYHPVARSGHPVISGLIHHSDHGSVYTSIHYTQQLELAGVLPSFGTVGDSYDNALAETVNGLYKAECVFQDGPFRTLTDVEDATLDWVNWYNTCRLHEYLDYRTPDEVKHEYYSLQQPLDNQQVTQ